jgi:membrane protease YdiL (CAAX protease family)
MVEPAARLKRTLLFGFLVVLASGLSRTLAMQGVAAAVGADLSSSEPLLRRDGLLLGWGILAGVLGGGGVLALGARPNPTSALALRRPTLGALLGWLMAAAVLVAATDVAAWLTQRPLWEPAWRDAYRTAPVSLLVVALVATSIFEELYFRGFLHTGLASTRLGARGAIAVTALLFAAAHFPQDAWRFLEVLASGVLFGLARHYSGSSLTTVLPHVLGNLKVLVMLASTS